MNISTYFCPLMLILITSCHSDQFPAGRVVIRGRFLDKMSFLNGQKVFLSDAHKRGVFKDSAIVENGNFSFDFLPDSSFVPFLARITYIDTYRGATYYRPIGFLNPYLAKNIENVLYVDKGLTEIWLDTTISSASLVNASLQDIKIGQFNRISQGSIQNQALFKRIQLRTPGDDKKKNLDFNISIIRQYPYSLYILYQMAILRNEYDEADIKSMLEGFDPAVKQTEDFKFFDKYFSLAHENGTGPAIQTNFFLEEEKSQKQEAVLDEKSTVNLLVFWASWCGPCRREIPWLKKIFSKYASKGVSISSISIDDNKDYWKKAVQAEQMPWKQFIVGDSSKNYIDLHFNVHEIPKLFIVYNNDKLLATGHINTYEEIDSTIYKLLNRGIKPISQ